MHTKTGGPGVLVRSAHPLSVSFPRLMKRPFFFSAAYVLLLAALLTACEDPSNVGIGLIGEQGGDPVVIEIAPDSFKTVPLDDVTGGSTLAGTLPDHLLVGTVDDPLLGSIRTESFFDLGSPVVTGSFRDNTVSAARIELRPDYVYGDTTAAVTFRLRSVGEEFTADNAPADTTFPAGETVAEFTIQPTDTLVSLALPAAYLSQVEATLRSTSFVTEYHGLVVEPVSGTAVVGFDTDQTRLVAVADGDSAVYRVQKAATVVERTSEPSLPEARLALQNGAGPANALVFDLSREALANTAVNRAVIRVHVDTLLLQATGTFRRPSLERLDLVGITETGETVGIERATLDKGAFTFRSGTLRRELQNVLLGTRTFTRFELRPPITPGTASILNTLDALILYHTSDGEHVPAAVLTVTPLDS